MQFLKDGVQTVKQINTVCLNAIDFIDIGGDTKLEA